MAGHVRRIEDIEFSNLQSYWSRNKMTQVEKETRNFAKGRRSGEMHPLKHFELPSNRTRKITRLIK